MKRIEDIEKLTSGDLLQIGADESIPVPEDLQVRLPRRRLPQWSIAAAVALLVGLAGWSLAAHRSLKDTFDDPYLAYAAVEQALGKMSRSVQSAAVKVDEAENLIDKYSYWK